MGDTDRLTQLETEVGRLHAVLQARGVNTTGETDIFGRPFHVPVDAEHKATVFNAHTLLGCANPHMRSFWASTFGFFSTFFSTFAAAPLMVYIKKEGSLNLSKEDIGNSNIASVAGTIFMRLLSGWICEKFGARKGFFFLLMLAVPGVIGITFTQGATGFIFCRFIIGLGLASFVTCQVWCSQMFNKKIIGAANATAGGWGNLGGGITNLTMPFVMAGFLSATDDDEDLSWRLCYIVPLGLHLIAGIVVLSGRDLPDGNFGELETSGAKQKTNSSIVLKLGASNINAWILTVTYGFCFGVELTMTNVAALYFYTYHGASPKLAGLCASCFGLMNLFARSWGGIISDSMNAKFGMRGRLWSMWLTQVVEGMFCIIMGSVTQDYASPDDGLPKVVGQMEFEGDRYSLLSDHKDYLLKGCGNKDMKTPDQMFRLSNFTEGGVASFTQGYAVTNGDCKIDCVDFGKRILLGDLDNSDCIRNQDMLGSVVAIMICFSITVQMAEGLHFGVVPYVCRPALGIVSGMVGAGGNTGAVITLWTIFKNKNVERTDDGFIVLGAVIIGTSLLMWLIYFPTEGGLFFKGGSLPYNPQRVKVPEGYQGADMVKVSSDGQKDEEKRSATNVESA